MKVALVTFGSAGDVHPMLALGQSLKQRGHRVTLLTNPVWSTLVGQAGLDMRAVGSADVYEQTLAHPKLWHPVNGLGVMWRYMLRPLMRPTYEALTRLKDDGLDAVVAPPVVFGARLASERWRLPLLTVITAATMLRSTQAPLTVAAWRVPHWVPSWSLGALWRGLDRFKLELLVRPALDPLRQELGLSPIKGSVFGEWMHSPAGGLALFPPWFAKASDWPANLRLAGFLVYDGDTGQGLSPELASFLDQGEPPVVFLPGTAQRFADDFYEAAAVACQNLGIRGLLLGPHAPAMAGGETLSEPYAPLSLVLPKAKALVHHGGIGTCAQALKWGVPQGVLPSAYDQFDNAMRLEHLGVGACMPMARINAKRMSQLVKTLATNGEMLRACQRWKVAVDVEAFRQQACDAVEALET